MRLQKYLAQCGVASRRKAEEYIAAGRVEVNGLVVDTPGFTVDPDRDEVVVDGARVSVEKKVYYLLNKPRGYVSSTADRHAERLVTELVPAGERLHTVGRLDRDTQGLIILTNDGSLTQKLTHPGKQVAKTYEALVSGFPSRKDMEALAGGVEIELDDGTTYLTAPAQVMLIKRFSGQSLLTIAITEGKKRQVRKMCAAVGHPVIALNRTAIGSLTAGELAPGDFRELTPAEVEHLGRTK